MRYNFSFYSQVDNVRQRADPGRHIPNHVYQHPPPPMQFTVPPPNYVVDNKMNHIGSMEFRRGGKGSYKHNKEDKQQGRPTQQYYEPPRQRDTDNWSNIVTAWLEISPQLLLLGTTTLNTCWCDLEWTADFKRWAVCRVADHSSYVLLF